VSPYALYVAATLATPAVVPYTLLIMEPAANRKLMAMANAVEAGTTKNHLAINEARVVAWLRKWKSMNYVRAGLVGTGALLGAVASIVA